MKKCSNSCKHKRKSSKKTKSSKPKQALKKRQFSKKVGKTAIKRQRTLKYKKNIKKKKTKYGGDSTAGVLTAFGLTALATYAGSRIMYSGNKPPDGAMNVVLNPPKPDVKSATNSLEENYVNKIMDTYNKIKGTTGPPNPDEVAEFLRLFDTHQNKDDFPLEIVTNDAGGAEETKNQTIYELQNGIHISNIFKERNFGNHGGNDHGGERTRELADLYIYLHDKTNLDVKDITKVLKVRSSLTEHTQTNFLESLKHDVDINNNKISTLNDFKKLVKEKIDILNVQNTG